MLEVLFLIFNVQKHFLCRKMVEYNEALTLYQNFIEKNNFFPLFFSIQGTSGTILRVPRAVWDRNFNGKRWFKGVF